MKEIKAYIRPYAIEKIIQDLENLGVPGITIVEVHPVGYGFQPNYFSQAGILKSAPQIVKLEIICHDEQVESFVDSLLKNASMGSRGDGMIFITAVEEAIRVRDGERGADVL